MTTTDTVTHKGAHLTTSIRRDDSTGHLGIRLQVYGSHPGIPLQGYGPVDLTPKEAAELAQRLYALALEVASADR
jgi:hypothetical protein